jgi:hypothetical protein
MGNKKKVAICVPTRGEMEVGTAFDLALMCGYDSRFRKDGHQALYTVAGTLIFDQREKLAETALREGADYILWVDADMRFPKNTIQHLMSLNKDIVGANATTRVPPIHGTAKNAWINKDEKTITWQKISSKDKKGLERVTAIGPWFWFEQLPGEKLLGEDVYFCVKAHDAGFETWVDHDFSNVVGHVGSHTFGWHDVASKENDGSDELLYTKNGSCELSWAQRSDDSDT